MNQYEKLLEAIVSALTIDRNTGTEKNRAVRDAWEALVAEITPSENTPENSN